MPISGKEYAELGKTDMATVVGMRIAMVDALKEFKALPAEQQTLASAKEAIAGAAKDNAYLKAAGTSNVVTGYYHDLFDRQKDDAKVLAFLKDASRIQLNFDSQNPPSKNELVMQAFTGKGLPAAGEAFNSAAEKHLGIKTLTHDFINTLKKNPDLVDTLETPGALSPKQAQFLNDTYELMKLSDLRERDPEKKIGAALIPSTPQQEAKLTPLIEAAQGLEQGKEPEKNRKILLDSGILDKETAAKAKDFSDKDLAESALDAVQRSRTAPEQPPASNPQKKQDKTMESGQLPLPEFKKGTAQQSSAEPSR